MDALFELLGEIIGGLYFGLAEILLPDRQFTKAQKTALQALCYIVMLGAIVVLGAGVIFLVDGYGFKEGVIMSAVGGVLVAGHIAAGAFVIVREYRKSKQNKKNRKKRGGAEEDGGE